MRWTFEPTRWILRRSRIAPQLRCSHRDALSRPLFARTAVSEVILNAVRVAQLRAITRLGLPRAYVALALTASTGFPGCCERADSGAGPAPTSGIGPLGICATAGNLQSPRCLRINWGPWISLSLVCSLVNSPSAPGLSRPEDPGSRDAAAQSRSGPVCAHQCLGQGLDVVVALEVMNEPVARSCVATDA